MTSGRNTVYCIVCYSVTSATNEIVLDWAGRMTSKVAQMKPQIKSILPYARCAYEKYLVIPFKYINPGYRISAWLGTIFVGLGILSVILT